MLDGAASNSGSPASGGDAQARDEAAPRPSWRSAALDWPARTNLAQAPPFAGACEGGGVKGGAAARKRRERERRGPPIPAGGEWGRGPGRCLGRCAGGWGAGA